MANAAAAAVFLLNVMLTCTATATTAETTTTTTTPTTTPTTTTTPTPTVPIEFYNETGYGGVGRALTVRVDECYNVRDADPSDVYPVPGSIGMPDDCYFTYYRAEDCLEDRVTFCPAGCECHAGHVDLADGNWNCFVRNIWPRASFCPGQQCRTDGDGHWYPLSFEWRHGLVSFRLRRKTADERGPGTVLARSHGRADDQQ